MAETTISTLPPMRRVSLRASGAHVAAVSVMLGFELPTKPCMSSVDGLRAALWLGPDEWLLLGVDADELQARCRRAGALCSVVDISHRHAGLMLAGEAAEDVLAAGCPLDLSAGAFPTGACARSIFGKAEVVIWRTGAVEFRLECWRSFEPYVAGLLAEAVLDARF